MLNIVPLFLAHQHERLLQLTLFDLENLSSPFDDKLNRSLIEKMVAEYYIPAGELLLKLAGRYGQAFKFALMLSGSLLELLKRYNTQGMDLFRRIVESGCAELVFAPCYSALSALYDQEEYLSQIERHHALLEEEFGVDPVVFYHDGPLDVGEVAEVLASRELRVLLIRKPANMNLISGAYHISDGQFNLLMCCDIDTYSQKGLNATVLERNSGDKENVWVCPVAHLEKTDRRFFSTFRGLVHRTTRGKGTRLFFPSEIASVQSGDFKEYSPLEVESGRHIVKQEQGTSPGAISSPGAICEGKHSSRGMDLGELERNAATVLFSLTGEARRKGDTAVLEELRRLSVDDHFYEMRAENENVYLTFLWALTYFEIAMTTRKDRSDL